MHTVKLSFELNIRRLHLESVEDGIDFTILWVRGEKKIDTRTRQSDGGQIKFSEKFMMKTNVEYNSAKDEYYAKPVSQACKCFTSIINLVSTTSPYGKEWRKSCCRDAI